MRGAIRNLLADLRQLTLPHEFRIARPCWPDAALRALANLAAASMPPATAEPAAGVDHLRLLAEVGTGLWRMRQKMIDPATDRPFEDMRRAYRHLESTWDALSEAGITIRDHTGEPVPEGGIYGLKTIARQPTPGLTRACVSETVKPSIYCGNQMIQMGEVVVGIPDGGSTENNSSSSTSAGAA